MQGYLAGVSEGTRVLLILSVILFAGFIMTRLTNTLNLPKVSGIGQPRHNKSGKQNH